MAASWTPASSFRSDSRDVRHSPSPVLSSFTRPPTPGGVFQSTPRWYSPRSHSYTSSCVFCSSTSHYVRKCPEAAQYLRQGKIIYNSVGKISLPNGRYPPGYTPGKNLRERIDNYRDPNHENYYSRSGDGQNHNLASSHYLEIVDESGFNNNSPRSNNSHSPPILSTEELWQLRNLIYLLSERIRLGRLEQSRRVESPMRPVSLFRTRNNVSTGFPQSRTHDNISRSPSPRTPRTPPKSATFRSPNEDRFDNYPSYTSHQPRSPMIPINYHSRARTITESSSRTTLDPPLSTISESCYQPPIRTSTRDTPVNCDPSVAIPDREHRASPDDQSARPRGPMIPIAIFRYSSPAITGPDSPKMSRTTADYHNTSPTIADYPGNSQTTTDHPETSRNVAKSRYWPAIKTSIEDAPEDSNLDVIAAISTREHLPASPSVPSRVSDSTPSSSQPSTRVEEDSSDSGLSALPEFDEVEEIIDFYLSFESDPPNDTSLDNPSEFDDSIDAYADSRDKDNSPTPPYHPETLPFRPPESQSAIHASQSSVSPPARSPPPHPPLENSCLDNLYEFSDSLDAYVDPHAENNSTPSQNEPSISPDSDTFRHQSVSPAEIAISATTPRTPQFSGTAKSRFSTIQTPRHSLSPISRHSATFSTALRSRL